METIDRGSTLEFVLAKIEIIEVQTHQHPLPLIKWPGEISCERQEVPARAGQTHIDPLRQRVDHQSISKRPTSFAPGEDGGLAKANACQTITPVRSTTLYTIMHTAPYSVWFVCAPRVLSSTRGGRNIVVCAAPGVFLRVFFMHIRSQIT